MALTRLMLGAIAEGTATVKKTADDHGDIDDQNNILELYCQSDGGTNRGLQIGSSSSTSSSPGNQWVYDSIHPNGAHYFNVEQNNILRVLKDYVAILKDVNIGDPQPNWASRLDVTGGTNQSAITAATTSDTYKCYVGLNSSGTDMFYATGEGNGYFAGTITDGKGNVRAIPKVTRSSSHTLIASDAGKCMFVDTANGITINDGVMSEGEAVTIVNAHSGDITIAQDSGMTLINAADAATGTRTLASKGMATVWFAANDTAYISGAGLS